MTYYEDFEPLYDFLNLKRNPKKHQIDTIGWKIVKYLQNQILATNKVVIHGAMFVALICDEITTLDDQSLIFSMVIVFKIAAISQFCF